VHITEFSKCPWQVFTELHIVFPHISMLPIQFPTLPGWEHIRVLGGRGQVSRERMVFPGRAVLQHAKELKPDPGL
jgi:hypothetical protein